MKIGIVLSFASMVLLHQGAVAAAPKPRLVDHSTAAVMDKATAIGIVGDGIPARVWKLYPTSRWTFVSQVQGGVTASGTCVITAQVMMLPLTETLKAVLFRPTKSATAYDALPNATPEQCKALGKTKLKEAVEAVVSSLVRV